MKSIRFLPLSLVLVASACGGARGGAGATEPTAADAELLPTGGCDVVAIDEQVKRVDPRALPWTYLVVKDAQVQCEDRRVVVQLAAGVSVVLASIEDDANGSGAARVGPELVRAIANDLKRVDPNAALSGEREAALGRESLPAYCGRVDLTSQGIAHVSQVCAAYRTTGNASHFVLVAITDTEESFAQVGMSVDELVGGLVNGFSLE